MDWCYNFTEQGYIVKDTYTFDDLDSKTYNFYFNDVD